MSRPRNLTMAAVGCVVNGFVHILIAWSWFRDRIWPPGSAVPNSGFILGMFLTALFGTDDLKKLEFLSEYFFSYGLFRFQDKVYIIDTKYCQTVINRLDKGAEKYLSNSPLSNSFLNSSHKSPDVRRSVAAIFRKSSMEERGVHMIKDIEKMMKQISREKTINVNEFSLKLAFDIVGHVILDLDLQALDGKQDQILECMMTILHKAYALGKISYDSQEFISASELFDKLASGVLEDALDTDGSNCDTSLPRLLHDSCGFEEAKDNLKLFLMAGSETTASTLPVVLYVLASHPHIQMDLQREADEYIGILRGSPGVESPLMERCLKEILRLYPIAPYISRHTDSGLTLGRIYIPEQTDLRIFTWGIHRSPFIWADSKQFKPNRFCKFDPSFCSRSYSWIPFGAGSRVCIGQHMAWVELRLVLTFLLCHFTFSILPGTPELQFCVDWEHAVVHPLEDVVLEVKQRMK